MKNLIICFTVLLLLAVFGCGSKKNILSGNKFAVYKKNPLDSPTVNELIIYKVNKPFKATISDKTDYYTIKGVSTKNCDSTCYSISEADPGRASRGPAYYPDEKIENQSLTYWDGAAGLQALTIPLKFRSKIGDGSLYPSNVETGINLGFAGLYKWNYNIFNPDKKFLGKSLKTISISTGLITGLGATQLKAATNAPALKPDRQSGMFTYGAVVLIGFNNINIGYAIGKDNVFGSAGQYWIYQHKTWQGIILSLDVVKF